MCDNDTATEEVEETEELLASMPSGEVSDTEELPDQGTEADMEVE